MKTAKTPQSSARKIIFPKHGEVIGRRVGRFQMSETLAEKQTETVASLFADLRVLHRRKDSQYRTIHFIAEGPPFELHYGEDDNAPEYVAKITKTGVTLPLTVEWKKI